MVREQRGKMSDGAPTNGSSSRPSLCRNIGAVVRYGREMFVLQTVFSEVYPRQVAAPTKNPSEIRG